MAAATSNAYSSDWFKNFHVGISAARTAQEAAFVCRCCPLPDFARLLDVCCGMGRHSRALAEQGYLVTGLERDAQAVTAARALAGGPSYLQADVRDYCPEPHAFDAVIVMSQSFGYFDAATNGEILARLASALRPRGRLILDLWNPEFFITRQGEHTFELPAGTVRETKRVVGDRLCTRLDYPNGNGDAFEFQLFSPAQMARFAQPAGLTLLAACTDFDAAITPSAEKPKVQYLLEHR